jgi:lipopolysaccharide heptosyltransferase I
MQPPRKARAPAILLVKTSSMGDVVHALPAISDLAHHLPDASIDWMVEDAFADLPRLHPAIRNVIPVAMRRWRQAPWSEAARVEFARFRTALRWQVYDVVIDAQGLLKSALLARFAHGEHAGQGFGYAREPLAALFYRSRVAVPWTLPAIAANRAIVAAAVGFTDLSASVPDYGLNPAALDAAWLPQQPYAVLLHAASNQIKLWADNHWLEIGRYLHGRGLNCVLPGGTADERAHADKLAAGIPGAVAAPALRLGEAAGLLKAARLVIGVDSGLTHLAAAVGTPAIALFSASDPSRTGVVAMQDCKARNLGKDGEPPAPALVIATADEFLA